MCDGILPFPFRVTWLDAQMLAHPSQSVTWRAYR